MVMRKTATLAFSAIATSAVTIGASYGSQNVTWFDESDINSNGHYITYPVATLQGLEGSSQPGLNFQGIIS